MQIDYQKELNGSQFDAVEYCDGPEMVIAGAGSGKTRVLTYKIAYLIERGYKPSSIMALTFTNKAATEMRNRIEAKLGAGTARHLWMGTFHSIFSRLLRYDADRLGYTADYVIYDQQDSKNLIKTIIKDMGLDEKVYKPASVQSRISMAKNKMIFAHDYAANKDILSFDRYKNVPLIYKVYQNYQERLKQSNAMDFDDLLLNMYLLLKNYPDIQNKFSSEIQYMLVDEYQDTNYVQHCIVWLLTQKYQHVCVVGDDAQSIYSFRGANIDNMLKFTQLYQGTKIVKLEQNYRSTQVIVNAANSIIDHNQDQIKKNVFSQNEIGEKIVLTQTNSDIMESETACSYIMRLHSGLNVDYGQIAILYRTNAQSRKFEEILTRRGIPYRLCGSTSFYQRKEIKDVLAYCRLAINHNDEESFKRIVNYPARKIGDTTVLHLQEAAYANSTSLWQVACNPVSYGAGISAPTIAKLAQFVELIESFANRLDALSAYDFVKTICSESGIFQDLHADLTPEGMSRIENVEELLAGIQSAAKDKLEESGSELTLVEYLNSVTLLTDQDTDKDENTDKVVLMTIHAAKGLEFDAVIIPGLEEDTFPSERSSENMRDLEEERRLFYVAITRARKYLYLMYANSRFEYGTTKFKMPSRFISELDPKYLSADAGSVRRSLNLSGYEPGQQYSQKSERPSYTKSTFQSFERKPQSTGNFVPRTKKTPLGQRQTDTVNEYKLLTASQLSVGMRVEHDRFGTGVVLSVEGSGDSTKVIIRFDAMGQKTLLLKFARLAIIK
ncbi:MAG: exodeoxyribonuclease V subunit gamma [Bacteroidaceae bacterium]|nr:exodeoxyribonuclease V subunit gamma [Bacteroidaceae bacterium]